MKVMTNPNECHEDGRGKHQLRERPRAAAENAKQNIIINALLR